MRPQQEAAGEQHRASLLIIFGVDGFRERVNEADVRTTPESPRHPSLQRIVIGVRVRAEAAYICEIPAQLHIQHPSGIPPANRSRVEVLVRECPDASSSDVSKIGRASCREWL